MNIRLLTKEDGLESRKISDMVWHIGWSTEKMREEAEAATTLRNEWGCFTDDGTLMAHIINDKWQMWFDGQVADCRCVGGVSTRPEYRNQGAIREMMRHILPIDRRDGAVFSLLYPFNHGFYRKFGYENAFMPQLYTFSPAALRQFRFDGWAKMWNPGESVEMFLDVFNKFGVRYNTCLTRNEGSMLNYMPRDPYAEGKFAYLLGDENGACAYAIYTLGAGDIIKINDMAYIGRRGLNAILGYFARFTADCKKIEKAKFPSDADISALINLPYEISREVWCGFMARVLNAEKALSIMKKPDNCDFIIRVNDELLPENGGAWRVTNQSVQKTDAAPDITVSEKALAQLSLGTVNLETASYRADVEIHKNEAMLESVFVNKRIFINADF